MKNVVPLPPRFYFLLALLLVWSTCVPGRAHGQTMTVENGGEIEMRNGGTWNLEGTTVDLGDTGATARIDESTGGRFANGQLQAIRTLNTPSQTNPAGLGAEISSGKDLGATTITRGHTVQTGNGNSSIARYFDISPTTNSNLDATLTVSYAEGELRGLTESKLVFFKSTDGGANWAENGFDGRNTSDNQATLTGIDSFSRWTLASEEKPLPVELVGFEAAVQESGTVRLQWKTAVERNNDGFKVQRRTGTSSGEGSPPGKSSRRDDSTLEQNWQTIGVVNGAGTTTAPQNYRFRDDDLPYAADSLHYRLKQVDVDGTTHLSDPITVARKAVTTLQLNAPYPNPASDQATVQYAVPSDQGTVTLRVYDVLGRVVRTVTMEKQNGRRELQLDVSRLSSGMYVLRLRTKKAARTKRFTVVK